MGVTRDRLRVEHPEWYCPGCGHLWNVHQENGRTQRSEPGDGVACYAAVDVRYPGPGADGRERVEYVWCGCEALLDPERAREVRRRQLAQRGQ